jgi:mono/diheme cytochrome c family protein
MTIRHALRTAPPALLLASASLLATVPVPPARAAGDSEGSSQLTYNQNVAPILAERCVACHRPGDIAPMSLRTYDEVRPWVKSIRKAIEGGEMPPWHADPAYGTWGNDRRLTDVERETLVRWLKQGAPEGTGAPAVTASVPAGVNEDGAWRLGKPDLEVKFEQVDLPAGGPDQFRDLPQTYPLPEDRWVSAVEIVPGDRRVVHHVIVYVIDEGQQAPNGWLGAWAAGMEPMVFPAGSGRLLKKGSRLIANMHYHPTDEAAHDSTTLGVYFLDREPQKQLVNLWVQNSDFKIPAGNDNYEVKSTYTFRQDSVIHALLPHMHYRGKDFTYTATYPDGRSEILLKVPAYDFNWQTLYQEAKPLEIPAGTRLDCVAHYDNSTKNKANPDPTKDVTFGNQSFDEMMIGFVDYTVKDGVSPKPISPLIGKLHDLAEHYPGQVWRVDVSIQPGKAPEPTAVHLPREGNGGWYVAFGTLVLPAPIHSIVWDGNKVTAKAEIPNQGTMEMSGVVLDSGDIDLTMGGGTIRGVAADTAAKVSIPTG